MLEAELSGVMNAPLTSIFLIAELSNGYGLFIPLMITMWENGLEDFFDKFPPKVLLNDIMEPNLFKMLAEDVHKNGVHCNELYFPSEIKMFRLCACGKYNWKNEPVCWNCGHDTDWWKTKISKEYLIQQMDEKEKLHQLEKERLAEEIGRASCRERV